METLTRIPFSVSREIGAALALVETHGIGPATARLLVDRHGSALAALEQAPDSLDVPERERLRLAQAENRESFPRRAERLATLVQRQLPEGARMVSYRGPGYPAQLCRLHDPPMVLWAQGPLPIAAPRAVAIIGTRSATEAGRRLARRISTELASEGVRIVSGLAQGIDSEAHRGALDANGETLAVLGSGLNFEYPRLNRQLYAELRSRGVLLTEFAPTLRPAAHQFPQRNRIVAALCDAVLVVQAGAKSGARITATHALDIGVDVLACPGPVDLPASEGCHSLLKDGAGLVTSAKDVLQALGWNPPVRDDTTSNTDMNSITVDGAAAAIVDRLSEGPACLDELAGLVGDSGRAAASLGRLEAFGYVRAGPGTTFERA
ncbi:MAG: DNA-protecting protein DprA [Gemmatimonadales bacterium]|nr:MAG: DNA-protecting protein DprA [Gemmatimonadales bacterium]